MRAAVDCTPLLTTRTGVGAFVAGAIEGLARRDDLDLCAYALSARGWRTLPAAVPAGVATRARPIPAGVSLRVWPHRDVPNARWVAGDADVVHGTNFVVPPPGPSGPATVVTVHDLTALRFPELCAPASLRYPDLVRRAVNKGAWVHTPSRFVAQEVVEMLGVPAERVRAIHHGLPALPAPGTTPRPVPGRYVLAVGTVEPRKGLPLLVRAFDAIADEVPDLTLVLAGPAGWGAADLAKARDEIRRPERVVWLGWVDDARRSKLLEDATLFAFPSRYEGFGFPPLEAMASGTPVVATSAGSLPEVLGDAVRFVDLDDVDSLSAALVELGGDTTAAEAERDRLAAAGRAHVAKFSWDDCAAGLRDLYADAIGAAS